MDRMGVASINRGRGDTPVWRLRRQWRIAEGHAYQRADGLLEVEVRIDDLRHWSCLYSDGTDALTALIYQRGGLEVSGWREG
jgi:hypothetical protein